MGARILFILHEVVGRCTSIFCDENPTLSEGKKAPLGSAQRSGDAARTLVALASWYVLSHGWVEDCPKG